MVVDTSAFVSILLRESGHEQLVRALLAEGKSVMSSPNLLECHLVLSKHFGENTWVRIQENLFDLSISVREFSAEHAKLAADAFDRFGKGRHPAGLNFGDCAAYALAKSLRQPLLFVGDDFSQTDINHL